MAEEVVDMDISIIIPLYRGNRYIAGLIHMFNKNLQKDNFGNNYRIEVIFVNDSPEEPIKISESLLCSFKLIQYEQNKGIHGARVAGLKAAEGEYIVMLDQDDQVTESWLSSQFFKLKESKGTYVVCNGWKSRFGALFDQHMLMNINRVEHYIEVEDLIRSPGQVMIKKSAIPQKWIENIQKKNGCDDWLLWIMALKEGNQFIVNQDMLYFHTPERNSDSLAMNQMMESKTESADILMNLGYVTKSERSRMDEQIKTDFQTYRFFELFRQLLLWRKLDQQGKKIASYLVAHGYHKVAIYGMGSIGEMICDELQDSEIECYGIDQSSVDFYGKFTIFRPDDEWPDVDLIIIAVTRTNIHPILDVIEKKNIEKVITFNKLLIQISEDKNL